MSQDSRKYLYLTRSRLRNFDIDNRRHWYASTDFPDELKRIARALAETGVDGESIRSLVGFGTEMMALTRNMTFSDWSLVRVWDGMGLSDSADSFFPQFNELVTEVVKKEASELTQQVLREIDAGFGAPIQGLAKTLPDDFAQSSKHLSDAVESFQQGRKGESALSTRKAWESCVNYALSRLPSGKGLVSLTKETEYVLDQLGMTDKSDSIGRIKNLFEGRFLHVIDSEVQVEDPELPFYIALTTGFVHLVASSLARQAKAT